MFWNDNVVQKLEWNGEISNLEEKQAIAEMNNPERLVYWQTLFEQQLDHPQQGEKQYVKLQCYIAAQLLIKLKADNDTKTN